MGRRVDVRDRGGEVERVHGSSCGGRRQRGAMQRTPAPNWGSGARVNQEEKSVRSRERAPEGPVIRSERVFCTAFTVPIYAQRRADISGARLRTRRECL